MLYVCRLKCVVDVLIMRQIRAQSWTVMRLRGTLDAGLYFLSSKVGTKHQLEDSFEAAHVFEKCTAYIAVLIYMQTPIFPTNVFILGRYRDLSFPRREDPHQMDGSRGHRLQEVHHGQRRVELWNSHVGGGFVRGAALLGHEQPGRESFLFVLVLPVCHSVFTPFTIVLDCFIFPHKGKTEEQSKIIFH